MTNIYGAPSRLQFGHVIAGIDFHSPRQAMLMERLLQRGMADYAGRQEETLLAKWHNEVVSIRVKAEREGWTGWQDISPVTTEAGEQ